MKVEDLTKRMQKEALVEVQCGLDHASVYIPGKGWKCRYARGMVTHKESGLLIKAHSCHWCNGYFLLPALTKKEDQICDNCGGPAIPTGQLNVWPDLVVVEGFLE